MIPGLGRPLEKRKATHSSILACRIPWTSPWGCKESDTTERLSLSHTPARNVGQGSLFHFAVRKVSFRKRKEGSAQEKLEDLEVRKDLQIQKAWDMEVGLAQSAFPQRAELCRRHMQGTTKCRALWASEPRSFICQLADAGETLTSLSISLVFNKIVMEITEPILGSNCKKASTELKRTPGRQSAVNASVRFLKPEEKGSRKMRGPAWGLDSL